MLSFFLQNFLKIFDFPVDKKESLAYNKQVAEVNTQ